MKPTNNWNTTQAAVSSSEVTSKLTPGGHECRILKAEEEKDNYGNPILKICFDIAEGSEYDGFFMKKYQRQKEFNDKNSRPTNFSGMIRQKLLDKDGNTNPFFKGFITSVEKSNPGYQWNWQENTLAKKRIGVVFGEKEYSINGNTGFFTAPFYFCDADTCDAQPIPKPKLLQQTAAPVTTTTEMAPADDEPLPF